MGNNYKNEKLVQNAKSFRMILDTVKMLKHSQEFYSRLYDDYMEIINNDKEGLTFYLDNETLPKFKNSVDVVTYLKI